MAAKKFGYKIYASGYGTKTYQCSTKEEAKAQMKADAETTAAEYEGEVQDYGDEIVVADSRGGDEIARFLLI